MLGYNVRLGELYGQPVCSTVVYLLRGADAGDRGYLIRRWINGSGGTGSSLKV